MEKMVKIKFANFLILAVMVLSTVHIERMLMINVLHNAWRIQELVSVVVISPESGTGDIRDMHDVYDTQQRDNTYFTNIAPLPHMPNRYLPEFVIQSWEWQLRRVGEWTPAHYEAFAEIRRRNAYMYP